MQTYGPAIFHDSIDGTFRASCAECVFRVFGVDGTHCSQTRPLRAIPDADRTPDWCALLEGLMRDAREAAEAAA